MEAGTERKKTIAAFMAFGTKGDVCPIAAIAAAFASDQRQYNVFLITHSAHEDLSVHLAAKYVTFYSISSSPVLCSPQYHDGTGSDSSELAFGQKKRDLTRKHRNECYSAVEKIFGDDPSMEGDFIVINFFALEGWSLAELFRVHCIVAAPYVVPYSAPSSFEDRFIKEHPLLYKYLKEAPTNKVCWGDVIHWMWPLFTENWGSWRSEDLNLSPCPFTDPVTALPTWHYHAPSPKLLYGFSKEIVECPDYWPSSVRVCGFWFLPNSWQYSCNQCGELSAFSLDANTRLCGAHLGLQAFLEAAKSMPPIFVGLSSVASMGFLKNPQAFLRVLHNTTYRFILFTAGYEPLDAAIQLIAPGTSSLSSQGVIIQNGISLFDGKLFCFSGMVPYNWLFPRCLAAIHHGGSGTTAAALYAGISQFVWVYIHAIDGYHIGSTWRNYVHPAELLDLIMIRILCPFMLDQFYWAERMFWLGVASEPLKRNHLVPDNADNTSIKEAAAALSKAIQYALSPKVKACAKEIAGRISSEDGVSEAVKILKEELRL